MLQNLGDDQNIEPRFLRCTGHETRRHATEMRSCIGKRRLMHIGMLKGTEDSPAGKVIKAEVPLSEMFGYATDLRSATQGRATYTMEFEKYHQVPPNIAEGLKN